MTSVPITRYSISGFQQKSTRHAKRQEKTQCEEPKQISEPDSDMTQSLILSGRSLKQLQSNTLRARTDRY